ncbi:MAG: hypothetical protein K6D92_04470 [Erysipelotrichaceae bacterium]|nr:hypothetical protein [Erysipelotrichaceae bacterium]
MKKENHPRIRAALREKGKYLWELGPILGVSEQTITRLMRKDLTEDEENEIISKINEAADDETGI